MKPPHLRLLAGLSLALAALAAAIQFPAVMGFDHAVLARIASTQPPATEKLWWLITQGGSVLVVSVLTILVAGLFYYYQHGRAAIRVVITMAIAAGLETSLKYLIGRARPMETYAGTMPDSYSFPSGHTLFATALYGVTALLLAKLCPAWRRPLFALASVLALAVGLSRMGLAVHFPTDVAAGFVTGGLSIILGSIITQFLAAHGAGRS